MLDESTPLRLSKPDRTFVLSDSVRTTILPGFDLDALERLLARTRPEFRDILLGGFQPIDGPGFSTGPLTIPDPILQNLLHEVWAPRWEHFPPDAWDDPDMDRYPGKEIARARRNARGEADQREPKSDPDPTERVVNEPENPPPRSTGRSITGDRSRPGGGAF
jgi:hypothetical protein